MSGHHIPPAWSERGYVPPDRVEAKDEEDDKGEAAYMRCFHDSSKIGRVPNAAYFTNSATARAYVEKRDRELFPVKEVSRHKVPNPDLPSWSSRKETLTVDRPSHADGVGPQHGELLTSHNSANTTSSHLRPQQQQPPPQYPRQQQPTHAPQPNEHAHIPWSMEPRTSARGPPNKLR